MPSFEFDTRRNRTHDPFMAKAFRTFVATALGCLAPLTVISQTRSGVPRMPDGHPDLEGIWTNGTITPLERPRELADKPFFTAAEAAEYEKQARDRNNGDRRDANTEADLATGYNDFWW